jgi:hypothetical protein
MRSLLLVENFEFRPSNQHILVRVIPSCLFCENVFVPGKSPIKMQPQIHYIILVGFVCYLHVPEGMFLFMCERDVD